MVDYDYYTYTFVNSSSGSVKGSLNIDMFYSYSIDSLEAIPLQHDGKVISDWISSASDGYISKFNEWRYNLVEKDKESLFWPLQGFLYDVDYYESVTPDFETVDEILPPGFF